MGNSPTLNRNRRVRKKCPLTRKDRIVIEDRSPLGIMLLIRKSNIMVNMERIHNIGVLDGIIANRRPTTYLGVAFSSRCRFNNDDLSGTNGTTDIHQILKS